LRAEHSALAIFRSQASAEKIIDASPLRFELLGKLDVRKPRTAQRAAQDGKHQTSASMQNGEDETEDRSGSVLNLQRHHFKEAGTHSDSDLVGLDDRDGHSQASIRDSSRPTSQNEDSSASAKETREFHLEIDFSHLNHLAYIQRQYYCNGFEPDTSSVLFKDLQHRVPTEGMADCDLSSRQVPLRLRQKRVQEDKLKRRGIFREPLRELWRRGQQERELRAQEEAC